MAESGIGYFGDERLRKNGAVLLQRMIERQAVCVRKLGDDRPEQVKFRRFLYNEAVTVTEMVAHRATFVAVAAQGRHVLAIQDTSEINYQAQSGRKRRLGKVCNGSDIGLFVHPVLGVDAQSEECLGLIDVQVWRRTKGKAANYKSLPIEQKESYRWLRGGHQAKAVLADASMVTILDDREGDIYEKWARLPDAHTHLLTRACRDRSLADGGKLFSTMADFPEAHRYEIDVPARQGKRSARQAGLAVRFGQVRIRRSGNCSDRTAPAEIELFALEVRELDAPAGEEPILWRLLTTHRVETVAQAISMIGWYRQRWNIEQLFRTVKRQGLGLEQSAVEDGAALEKLAVIALIGATVTMQLVLARAAAATSNGSPTDDAAFAGDSCSNPALPTNHAPPANPVAPASRVFDPEQIMILQALQNKLQGRTTKQHNPYPSRSLAWAAWTIARLGGWTGYDSDKSSGPITMRDGLQRFSAIVDGFQLAENVCSS
jgi:DDE family transposase